MNKSQETASVLNAKIQGRSLMIVFKQLFN